MIPRYSRPEMTAIWEPENRFRIWLEIEAHACDAQAELGVIPKEAARAVWERGAFEVTRFAAAQTVDADDGGCVGCGGDEGRAKGLLPRARLRNDRRQKQNERGELPFAAPALP